MAAWGRHTSKGSQVHLGIQVNNIKQRRCASTARGFKYQTVGSLFQTDHEPAMTSFMPAASHKTGAISPVAFVIQPPAMAPRIVKQKASILRSRFPFRKANNSSSETKSHKRLVMTTVGISLKPKARLATIWPADWKLSSTIADSCDHSALPAAVFVVIPATTPP